jgi:hypothetical protein
VLETLRLGLRVLLAGWRCERQLRDSACPAAQLSWEYHGMAHPATFGNPPLAKAVTSRACHHSPNCPRLRKLGLTPRTREEAQSSQQRFPYVLFAAPPSGSEDYPAEVGGTNCQAATERTAVCWHRGGVVARTPVRPDSAPTCPWRLLAGPKSAVPAPPLQRCFMQRSRP